MFAAGLDRSIQALLQERPRPLRKIPSAAPITPLARTLIRNDTPTDYEKTLKPVALRPADEVKPAKRRCIVEGEVDMLVVKAALPIATVLGKLFSALDVVLGLSANRGSHLMEAVRRGVELHSAHELDDARLAQVLVAAGGMLDVRWLGAGTSARLEIWQVAPDGKARVPTAAELSERRARFETALASAAQIGGVFAQAFLPERPAARTVFDEEMRPDPKSECADDKSSTSPVSQTDGADAGARMVGIRQRMLVRQRKTQEMAGMKNKLDALHEQIGAHDDATTLHSVVVQLFARFQEGTHASASDAEVIYAVSAFTRGAMCKRSMDTITARSALTCLTATADSWFRVEKAQYSEGLFLNRIPGGSAAEALTILREKLAALRSEHTQLLKQCAAATIAAPIETSTTTPAAAAVCKEGVSTADDNKSRSAATQKEVDAKTISTCAVVAAAPKGRDAKSKAQSKATGKTKTKGPKAKKSVWVG